MYIYIYHIISYYIMLMKFDILFLQTRSSWKFLFATTGWMRFSQTDHAPQRGFWPIPRLGDIGFTHSIDMVGYRWFWMILELDDVGSSWMMILDIGSYEWNQDHPISIPWLPWWLAKQPLFCLDFKAFLSLPYLKRFIRSEWNP